LLELTRQAARINDAFIRQYSRDDLLGSGVHGDVEFAPDAAIILAMSADFRFTFAEDFQAGGIKDEMADELGLRAEVDFEMASAARPQRVMRRSQFKVEEAEEGSDQPLSLRQRQMEELA
jgi:hypothetical protein